MMPYFIRSSGSTFFNHSPTLLSSFFLTSELKPRALWLTPVSYTHLSFKQALDYINTSIQASIPFIYFAIPMILLLIYAQFKGPTVFVRVGNFVIWLTLASYFIIMVTAVKEFEINNLRPFLVNGLESVAGNIWRFFPWCGNIVFLLMFFDKVDVKKGFEKKILTVVGIAYGIVLALDVIFLGVFGVMAKFMTFSIMELSQYLSGMVFSNRMDTIIRLIWILSAFVRDVRCV